MRPLVKDLLQAKRAGQALSDEDIAELVAGIVDGSVGNEQLGAFAMAVAINGMTRRETVALTRAMRDSGQVMDWRGYDLPGPVLDKHSTGGVGDATSLLIGPWVAACGGYVPMIVGRGLGHTGGTRDKLDAIPGYDTSANLERFARTVAREGVAIIGQTAELAPADGRLYAVRDVTGTVDCLPLIVASILSKKLAERLDGLVLDVKTGTGAVMTDPKAAMVLAEALAGTAAEAGTASTALLTDMNQPLATCAGHALEVLEIIDILTGNRAGGRLLELSRELAAEMLLLGELAASREQAFEQLDQAWSNGKVTERFSAMVAALGGPTDLVEQPRRNLPQAPVQTPIFAPEGGFVQSIDVRRLGMAVIALGGGRRRAADRIDSAVGLSGLVGVGERVGPERPLMTVHAARAADVETVRFELQTAFRIDATAATPATLIATRLRVG
jgi:thymidine phosphorylase